MKNAVKYSAFIFITFLYYQLSGQVIDGKFEKLAKLYISSKFEGCFDKAESYTLSDKTKKDAEPYLYISMCMVEFSESDDEFIQEEFRNAKKQAVKYAWKFVKKDKNDELYVQNIEFINRLKKIQKSEIKANINDANYRKAASAMKAYGQLNKEKDILVQLFTGICEV